MTAEQTTRTAHTPGPWILRTRTVKAQDGDYEMSEVLAPNPEAGMKGVCYAGAHFSVVSGIDSTPDARLIAAAPTLLAALEDALPLLQFATYWTDKAGDYGARARYAAAVKQAEAAIAAARGEDA